MSQRFFKVKDTAAELGISLSSAYELVKSGEIRSVRIGGALRVPAAAIDEFADGVTNAA
jgi:excisionase family DNA binding protein